MRSGAGFVPLRPTALYWNVPTLWFKNTECEYILSRVFLKSRILKDLRESAFKRFVRSWPEFLAIPNAGPAWFWKHKKTFSHGFCLFWLDSAWKRIVVFYRKKTRIKVKCFIFLPINRIKTECLFSFFEKSHRTAWSWKLAKKSGECGEGCFSSKKPHKNGVCYFFPENLHRIGVFCFFVF